MTPAAKRAARREVRVRRSAPASNRTWRRLRAVALVIGVVIAIAAPSEAAPAMSEPRVAFGAGYRTAIDDGTDWVATMRIPRADVCQLGDGAVTVQAFVLVDTDKIGAEFRSTCEAGSARYSGRYLVEGTRRPINYRMHGGDWITVSIEDTPDYTEVYVGSTRGWADGYGTQSVDLDGGVFTVAATGELDSAESAGHLSRQQFTFVRVGGHRLGATDPQAFDDSCSSASELRRGLSFSTSFIC